MMNDGAMKISDEMLAAYLDGNSIPLERLFIEEFYKLKYCSTVVYMVPRA